MRYRKAYELKNTVRLYNLVLVIINTYFFVLAMKEFKMGLEPWGCQAFNESRRRNVLEVGHLIFYLRYLEFMDTFLLILKKKKNQLSFLHIFHHAIVPTLMYIGLKFNPLPFNCMLPITNLFVHVIMYGYYGLSTFGPSVTKWLWWKKYLTSLQISQFALLIIHSLHPILLYWFSPGCKISLSVIIVNTIIGFTFLSLFVSFYRSTYAKQTKSSDKTRLINEKDENGFPNTPSGSTKSIAERPKFD